MSAFIYGAWAANPSFDIIFDDPFGGWEVTHVPSGLRVNTSVLSQRKARRVAKLLSCEFPRYRIRRLFNASLDGIRRTPTDNRLYARLVELRLQPIKENKEEN